MLDIQKAKLSVNLDLIHYKRFYSISTTHVRAADDNVLPTGVEKLIFSKILFLLYSYISYHLAFIIHRIFH